MDERLTGVDERGRWTALFADLEGELDGAEAAELDAEVADRTRAEVARLGLADRLTAAIGRPLAVTTPAGTVRGTLADASPAWLLLDDTLVPATAVLAIDGLPRESEPPGPVRSRLTLGYALRALARDAAEAVLTCTNGAAFHGRLGRVGHDFVEIGGATVPHAAIATVRPG